jgi:two-component system, NarL family, nitrate/nitrite response regulator NarL
MFTKKNILIADDHQIVIDGIISMLESDENLEIIGQAQNGQEAMCLISKNPEAFNFLIADVSMPLMSGIELCKAVKSEYPKIKVLILSMYSSSVIIKDCILAEADGYILKNASKEKLIEAINDISNDGTYYSEEVLPILSRQIEEEKLQKESLSILSKRELEVLELIVQENTSEEIAQKLFISKKTVDNHRASLLEKTDSKSTIALIKYAIKCGIEI